MTVRWKPLIVLSGLFLIVALIGLATVMLDLFPTRAADIVNQARKEWKAGRFDNADINFKKALQKDQRNAKIYLELARMEAEWADRDADKRIQHLQDRRNALEAAAKCSRDPEPRRLLLGLALLTEDPIASTQWANQVLELEPEATDAHYALAVAALNASPVDTATARKHAEVLQEKEASRPRTLWVAARIAQVSNDDASWKTVMDQARAHVSSNQEDAIDRLASVRLRELDVMGTKEAAELRSRLDALRTEAEQFAADPKVVADCLLRVGESLDEADQHRAAVAATSDVAGREALAKAAQALAATIEGMYQKALDRAGPGQLVVYQTYAQHLAQHDQRQECLALVDKALKHPAAHELAWADTVANLHRFAAYVLLDDQKNKSRFTQAEPHIKALLQSRSTEHQAYGHWLQGGIEIERCGLIDPSRTAGSAPATVDLKMRNAALNDLKFAAANLPDHPDVQAIYGIALILTGEQGLGRQYLSVARRATKLAARYRVWAALALLQAGYPEEAEPIVNGIQKEITNGTATQDLAQNLLMLTAEIHQARHTPKDLEVARATFEQVGANGAELSPTIEMRMAQLDVMLGQAQKGLDRVNALRKKGTAGAAAEHLAVLILCDMKKNDEARAVLDAARKTYPDDGDLAIADAMLRVRGGEAQKSPAVLREQEEKAEKVLADFTAAHPRDLEVLMTRAKLLSDTLKQLDRARELLVKATELSDTSGPLAQLALLDINRKDYKSAAATIAKIRLRWKEAATADLLDAQLAMARRQRQAALGFLDTALQKDPTNKLALFWKATLADQAGMSGEANKLYESIADSQSTKELDTGLTLSTAAKLARIINAMEDHEHEQAITGIENMLRGDLQQDQARVLRWQLATTRASKGEWDAARADIEAMLKDPKYLEDRATVAEERVRAANLYRLHGETARAITLLDSVLSFDPANTAAVAMRAYFDAEKEPAKALALLNKAVSLDTKEKKQPASIHLMIAAIENGSAPAPEGPRKALAVIEKALVNEPNALELIQAKYRLLALTDSKGAAIAYVAGLAKKESGADETLRRYYVDVLRDAGQYAKAQAVVQELLKNSPEDEVLADQLIRLVNLRGYEAGNRADHAAEAACNQEAAQLIKQFRTQFSKSAIFPQTDVELAMRLGQLDKANALTLEIDQLDTNSPAGPMLRAQIATMRGQAEIANKEYAEAVRRAPRRGDLRLSYAQTCLTVHKPAEAIDQVKWVLESDPVNTTAILIQARAMCQIGADAGAEPAKAARAAAIELVRKALAEQPKWSAGYHEIAAVQYLAKDRAAAIQTLQTALLTVPDDAPGLAMLVQYLSQPGPDGKAPAPADLSKADEIATRYAGDDKAGSLLQAASIGFHKAGQIDRGLTWAEKANAKLDDWVVHMNYGDLLMAKAEMAADRTAARPLFEQAIAQYDKVLEKQADSVEAVNNKAWVLLEYLDKPKEALDLAEGLMKRVDPSTLPADFFDTLGAIQEATNRPTEAEASYTAGLKRSDDHAALNFHLGRLLAKSQARAQTAAVLLKKAQAARNQLSPKMINELDTLLTRVQ